MSPPNSTGTAYQNVGGTSVWPASPLTAADIPPDTQVDWSNVQNTPTTLSGYGVTDSLLTTAPIAGGGVLASGLTITHATSGVTAGNYGDSTHIAAFHVDVDGHITAAASLIVPVVSVFGRTGAVVAVSGDYTVAQVTGAAPLASPTFTGTPAAPTASPGTNTTQLATTAFVAAAGGAFVPLAGGTMTGALILQGTALAGGTHYTTGSSVRVTMDLSFGSVDPTLAFTFPSGGQFKALEKSLVGTNDVFFQLLPATNAGYGILEAFAASGMFLSTQLQTSPVILGPGRVIQGSMVRTGFTIGYGDLVLSDGLRYGGTSATFAATRTLTKQANTTNAALSTSAMLQVLVASGAGLHCSLPSMVAGDIGYTFKFWNAGATNSFTVLNSGGSTILTVGTGTGAGVIWDGTTWRVSAF